MLPKLTILLKDLKNIFLVSIYWSTNKYPLSIVPKKRYVRKIDLETVSKKIKVYLIRRSGQETLQATFTKLNTLKEEAILERDLPGMSMFLLGGKLRLEHINFRQLRGAAKDWDGKKVYFIDFRNDYEKLKNAIPIYFDFEDINNQLFPYYRTGDKEAKRLIAELQLKPEISGGKYKLYGFYSIQHAATFLNYWHVELTIHDAQKKPIKDIKKSWSASAASQALGQIASAALRDAPISASIPVEFYVNN